MTEGRTQSFGAVYQLDDTDDAAVLDWFYDHKALSDYCHDGDGDAAGRYIRVNGPSYRTWRLPTPVMANLYWLAKPLLLMHLLDKNYYHLFNLKHFLTAKATPTAGALFRATVR
jgi:pre-mRNA-processing factor 8